MSKVLDIETFKDLRGFFYEELSCLNKKSLVPVTDEVVVYSSDVLESYLLRPDLYKDALGLNLLQAELLREDQQKQVYKDVADTALILVGYFSQSINSKIISHDYYVKIGQMAYKRMDSVYPDYLDVPGFYRILSQSFEGLTTLMRIFSQKNIQDPFKHLLIEDVSDSEMLMRGIAQNTSKKAS